MFSQSTYLLLKVRIGTLCTIHTCMWQLCAAMMSWVRFAENSQILYNQNFYNSNFLSFHLSGSTESVSKEPTQLIVQLKSSLWHIIVTKILFSGHALLTLPLFSIYCKWFNTYLLSRCLMVSTNQADPNCFYIRISWILI